MKPSKVITSRNQNQNHKDSEKWKPSSETITLIKLNIKYKPSWGPKKKEGFWVHRHNIIWSSSIKWNKVTKLTKYCYY